MKLDNFLTFLDENGVEYSTNEESVIMQEAPCCGGHRKIYFYKEELHDKPLFGKCMKCDTAWTSWTYLNELGYDRAVIDILHGTSDLGSVELGVTTTMGFDLLRPGNREVAKEKPKIFDITEYYKVPELPEHEASKYAVKRGWSPAFTDDILIDIFANAVVFVCREGSRVVGYQQRFLKPPFAHMKVKSAPGFKKTQHVMEFANDGDILICEGPFTALSAWHYGYHGVCTFGAGVSDRQIQLIAALAKKTGKRVGVAFDLDSAGKKGYRIVRMGMHWHNIETFRVRPAAERGIIDGKEKEINDLNDAWQAKVGVKVIPVGADDVTVPELEIPEEGM